MYNANRRPINLKVIRFELNFVPPIKQCENKARKNIEIPRTISRRKTVPAPPVNNILKKPNINDLIEELLEELYSDWSNSSDKNYGSSCQHSFTSTQSICEEADAMERHFLENLGISQLIQEEDRLRISLSTIGERLGRCVRARDRYRRQQKRLCAAFTVMLRHISGDAGARFSVTPGAADGSAEGGYTEWLHAMRLVARLPAGVPHHFRRKLWLTLAERYLNGRGVDWPAAERACFRGTALPDDAELGAQILKDLHRTGCSLFCGSEGRENQAMLRRVLLAYARWNKDVGYCQGFNMLAAIILEVMDKSESDSLKVMVYLVEAVLPEGYFADDLRGLSADMAAFRDLLRLRLPRLATHMDHLQRMSDGGGVEPPLPDVFTMQWFLTLYATWLPRENLLRIWDLVLLDGNEVLLLTALAIWDMLQDRILSARSADEYYSCMGGGAGAIYEAGDSLVTRVVALGSAPELPRLRNLHRYRVTPPVAPAPPSQPPIHSAMQTMTKRGLRLFYSEDEGDSSDDGNKMALATVVPRRDIRAGTGDRLSLDIGALKRQYARLRERQRQAHVILAAACARHAAVGVPTSPTSLSVNNLLLGKSAIVSSRGRRLGPPPGAIPPTRQTLNDQKEKIDPTQDQSSETISWVEEKHKKSLSRRNSLKWKDIKRESKPRKSRKASIDLDESGDGVIVSEREANEMIASLRSRSSSETSSYSSHSGSSTDTSLCDEGGSDSEPEISNDTDKHKKSHTMKKELASKVKSTTLKEIPKRINKDISPINSDINKYIKSAAGESLRSYISEFQHDNTADNTVTSKSNLDLLPPVYISEPINESFNQESDNKLPTKVLLFDNPSFVDDDELKLSYSPKKEMSKIISPCELLSSGHVYYSCSFDDNPKAIHLENRPPDIIDSFSKFPNFVPDIDLSDKATSDFDSPLRSPDADSIVVSEDEPPIPLKIDKYFEHSPEFFGARITVTDPNNPDIRTRRAAKRLIKFPRKPDSLTLQTSHNKDLLHENSEERASSLPHSYFKYNTHTKTENQELNYADKVILESKTNISLEPKFDNSIKQTLINMTSSISEAPHKKCLASVIESPKQNSTVSTEYIEQNSPKDIITNRLGRKNSERALQIIQENSKILSRILTKQNISEYNSTDKSKLLRLNEVSSPNVPVKYFESSLTESPLLRESTSDSLIGYNKPNNDFMGDKNVLMRNRPISIDDPFSLDLNKIQNKNYESKFIKGIKSPSSDNLLSKTDRYGWENKGFLAKCKYQDFLEKTEDKLINPDDKSSSKVESNIEVANFNSASDYIHDSMSLGSKASVTFPSTEQKDTSSFDHRFTSDDYNYPLSSRYNDFVLTKVSDICSKTVGLGPKVFENISKTDNSRVSDFTHVVTSSISFTYDPSAEDDSPIGGKSNSSDTLCQITSLDQVSTPISPKIFPRETPTLPKEFTDRSDRARLESEDTCSAITSLLETDTISSLSYPRSPTTGSYHPFPTRPAMRMPKELGVRLGMYPKDAVHSPSK